MLMLIHLRSASQHRLVIVLIMLSTIKIYMVPYKYTCEAFLQFPTLTGESPKWNILVVISVVPVLSTGTKSNSSTSYFILVPVLELELEQ